MTEESKNANPIVQFTYDSITNGYKTTLKDGTEGPFVSLEDMFVMKDLVSIDNEINIELSKATEARNTTTELTASIKAIDNDITDNFKLVQAEIESLKQKVR